MILSSKVGVFQFDGDEVRFVAVKAGRGKPVILEVHSEQAQYDTAQERFEGLVTAARTVMGKVKTTSQAYTLCVPVEHAVARVLSVPFRGGGRVAAAVPFELEPYLAIPIDELVVDHSIIGEADGGTEVLAAAVKHSVLREQADVLQAAGVRVEGANLDVAGLTSLWHAQAKPGSGLHAVVHLRPGRSVLAIVNGRSLGFYRQLNFDAQRFEENPSAAAQEIKNSLRAFLAQWHGEDEVATLSITGAEPSGYETRSLEEQFDCEVVYGRLFDGVKGAGLVHAEGPQQPNRWEALVGVGHAAVQGAYGLNFCKGDLAPPELSRNLMVNLGLAAGLLAMTGFGYAGYCYLEYDRNMAAARAMGQEVYRLFKDAFPNAEAAQQGRLEQDIDGSFTMRHMEQQVSEMAGAGEIVPLDLLARPSLLEILKDLAERVPSDKAIITELKVWPSDDKSQLVTISGEIREPQAFNAIFEELKKSELLTFEDNPQKTFRGDKNLFTLKAHT